MINVVTIVDNVTDIHSTLLSHIEEKIKNITGSIIETKRMQSTVYSNGNQECERSVSLLKSLGHDIHEYMVGDDFTQTEFEMEFGGDAQYPMISVGMFRGTLKETLNYLNQKGMLTRK